MHSLPPKLPICLSFTVCENEWNIYWIKKSEDSSKNWIPVNWKLNTMPKDWKHSKKVKNKNEFLILQVAGRGKSLV